MENSKYNEKFRGYIMKWRHNNVEKYNEYMLEYNKKLYQTKSEIFRKKRVDRYYFQKEAKRLCNILL
jgi:hypothetical protein